MKQLHDLAPNINGEDLERTINVDVDLLVAVRVCLISLLMISDLELLVQLFNIPR